MNDSDTAENHPEGPDAQPLTPLDDLPSDLGSDSGDSDLPEVSQIIGLSQGKATDRLSPTPEQKQEWSGIDEDSDEPMRSEEEVKKVPVPSPLKLGRKSSTSMPNPKEEAIEQEISKMVTGQECASVRKTKSSSLPTSERETMLGTSTSSSLRGTPARQHPPTKKRLLEEDDSTSNLPGRHPPLTQPVKRARRTPLAPSPASQPLPRTAFPSRSSSPFTPLASSSKTKGKGKQKVVLRKRNDNFWHLDGSVVIQVQNTLFRLHRSRLSQQSEYFATLFSRNEREQVIDADIIELRDIVDSCPVYVVKGVGVLDFERLLFALDAGIAYAITPPPFNVVASLLRAADALSFKTILTFAIHLFREMWPQDICHLTSEPRAHALESIILAQVCDIPEVLKRAYYELMRTPGFGQDLAVYVHAESTRSKKASRLHVETDEDEKKAPPLRLLASDFVRLSIAKEALQKEWIALTRPPLPSAFPCPLAALTRHESGGVPSASTKVRTSMERCEAARRDDESQWTGRLVQNGAFEEGMGDVFAGVQRLIEIDLEGLGYCVGCASERRDVWSATREKLWKRLDVLLGLKGEDEA